MQRARVVLPHPLAYWGATVAPDVARYAPLPLDDLRYRCVADTERMSEVLGFSSREIFSRANSGRVRYLKVRFSMTRGWFDISALFYSENQFSQGLVFFFNIQTMHPPHQPMPDNLQESPGETRTIL